MRDAAPSTRTKYLWALHGVLRRLVRHGFVERDLVERTLGDPVRRPRRVEDGRAVTDEEFAAMLRACLRDTNTVKGARDAAVLALLGGSGLRRSELAGLLREKVDLGREQFTCRAKGDRDRDAVLHPTSAGYLRTWLAHHPSRSGPVFVPVNKGGVVVTGAELSDRSVHRIVAARRDQANAHPDISPHSFRRWYVTSMLDAGVDLLTTMRAVGHSDPRTTQIYDKRPDRGVCEAVNVLQIPVITETDLAVEDGEGGAGQG